MNRGFSLVELSIVLVILGLLTGGILAGQSLIRAAELRTVSSDYQRYAAAIGTFRDKYFSVPGDMRNATSFWGYAGGTGCTNNTATANTSPGTCDGNGNGALSAAGAAGQSGEMFQFWRQLALAGLIEGTYTGLSIGNEWGGQVGTNVPASRMGNSGWGAQGDASANSVLYAIDYGNVLTFGGQNSNAVPQTAILTPSEAWNIDTKLDDGLPARGKVVAFHWNNSCAAADNGTHANNNLVASYRLSDNSLRCAFIFPKAF